MNSDKEVAKRKKTKDTAKRKFFEFAGSGKKKGQKDGSRIWSWIFILKVTAVICVLAAVGIGFVFLDKYVKKATSASRSLPSFELTDVPFWVNEPLKEKIIAAARLNGADLKLNENAASLLQQNIKTIAWLDEVKVQTTHNYFRIKAQWRKPVALVKIGSNQFYVDAECVVLDFVPMPDLPIVTVKGLRAMKKVPPTGKVLQREDIAAAVALLVRLDYMDKLVTPDKPLLYEIDRIDISNFNGRKNSRLPHIVLYAKDDTEIIWGAEVGTWQRHLEATDEEKLAKLYGYYAEYGSLLNNVKYINLRDPKESISLPIDKY